MGGKQDVLRHRVVWLDLARGAALLCMMVFHFAFDLSLFGVLPPGTTLEGGWPIFARMIAASFLFLSGISFILAHGAVFQARLWARRLAVIAFAALLVTGATYFVFPSRFVHFGILHMMAAASLFAPIFLRWPSWALAGCALVVIAAGQIWGRTLFDSGLLAWTGLSANVRPSVDFLPVVPYFAAFLAGMATARQFAMRATQTAPVSARINRLAWPGRNSLMVYLLHQPVLITIAWVLSKVI